MSRLKSAAAIRTSSCFVWRSPIGRESCGCCRASWRREPAAEILPRARQPSPGGLVGQPGSRRRNVGKLWRNVAYSSRSAPAANSTRER